MKTCENCKCIYADDYAGQCHDCGRPMGTIGGAGAGLAWNPIPQAQEARMQETVLRGGGHNDLRVDERVLRAARESVEDFAYLIDNPDPA